MTERATILAGFGGQGLLFAGQALARAALAEDREVFWIPSYGPEMRGGTAACTVIVGDEPIGSPVADRLDALIVLNPPSLAKYLPLLASGGLLVINDSLIEAEPDRDDIEVVRVPCTAIATRAGDERLTCIVALGALVARRPIVGREAVESALRALLAKKGPDVLAADLEAIEAGAQAARAGHVDAPLAEVPVGR
jgi:2-oxoglutarate ferredoxin oxidoreductase subunit gamma